MHVHRNAKLGSAGRYALVGAVEGGLSIREAARRQGVSPATACTWSSRWRSASSEERRTLSCLVDRSSRPHRSPRMLPASVQARICAEWRRSGHAAAAASPADPATRTRSARRSVERAAPEGDGDVMAGHRLRRGQNPPKRLDRRCCSLGVRRRDAGIHVPVVQPDEQQRPVPLEDDALTAVGERAQTRRADAGERLLRGRPGLPTQLRERPARHLREEERRRRILPVIEVVDDTVAGAQIVQERER